MPDFLHDDFLLSTPSAQRLYHEHAASMPIIDYHCHLPAEDIAADRQFANLTEAWLEGDHYKWRAMRINGVHEHYCTGDASDKGKFEAWAETVPHTVMNPLYHWTHLELRRYFGIDELLSPFTANVIYETCQELLQEPEFSCRGLLRQMNVRLICTTNDPIEALDAHDRMAAGELGFSVVPGFRADRASAITDPVQWRAYLAALSKAADIDVHDPDSLLAALRRRHDYFAARGCVVSDHGEETLYAESYSRLDVGRVFQSVWRGQRPSYEEIAVFKSWLLHELAVMDHEKGWTQQFHLAALRNANSRAPAPDSGYDSIGDFAIARPVVRFMDRLHRKGKLAKTILYSVNPTHNEVLASMCGNFSEGPIPGKIQFGTAWWFMDQIDGMERQLTALANMGLLSRFVGMLTDSRSFLSFPRHEYFRRILCGMIGAQIDRGELPYDLDFFGDMVEAICFGNAREYFGFTLPEDQAQN